LGRVTPHALGVAAVGRDADQADVFAEVLAPGAAVMAASAGHIEVDGDPVADAPALDAGPDRLDRSDRLQAGRVRQGEREPREVLPDVDVDVVEAACGHAYDHFTPTRLGVRRVLVAKCFCAAELVEANRLHESRDLPSSWIRVIGASGVAHRPR